MRSSAAMWMNLELVIHSERSQKREKQILMYTYTESRKMNLSAR